jgi:murein DD-endopeptidase MepM/ murein hydrolase activator NlpD
VTLDTATISMLGSIAEPVTPKSSDAEAAQQFESLIVKMMVGEMRKTLPDDGVLSGGDMEIMWDLFDQEIATRIAADGGIGVGALVIPEAGAAREVKTQTVWPVSGRVSSEFGGRLDPFTGAHRHHGGLDIAAPEGSAVMAARAGRVTFSGTRVGYGKVVIVAHSDGSESRYAHCSALLASEGDVVAPGTPIAAVGSTGRATGPHLHFEVREEGQTVDPTVWIRRHKMGQINALNGHQNDPMRMLRQGETTRSVRGDQ